jgi:hypothetical protein
MFTFICAFKTHEMETTLKFNETKKRFNIFYKEEHSYISQLDLKLNQSMMDGICEGNINLTLDLVFKFPEKEKVFKRIILNKDNLTTNFWGDIIYAGEFLREINIFSDKYFGNDSEITLTVSEIDCELTTTALNDEKLLKLILLDNWFSFTEEIRKLSSEDFKIFINDHLNGIQELNANELSTHVIEYAIAKQIIELYGVGRVDGAYLDVAAEAYVNGYDLIKKQNQLVIENYYKPDWMTLNIRLTERSDQVAREYSKLKEKIDRHMKDDKLWDQVINRLNDFTISAEEVYNDYSDLIENLIKSETLKNLDVFFQDWDTVKGDDSKREAKIEIQSKLPFGPSGFNLELVFALETNPTTYQQEFTITLLNYNIDTLPSERLRHTKIVHSLKSLQDFEALYEDRATGIELEFYNLLRDAISGSVIYMNSNFQSIK